MGVATLKAINQATRSANDVDLDVPDAQVEAVLNGYSTKLTGKVKNGTLAWPMVKYPEIEISGSAFEVKDVQATGTSVTVALGDRTDSPSAFSP